MCDIRKLYEADFDGIAYAKDYINGIDYDQKWVDENFFHRVFSQGITRGKVSGKSLIDVGCGPIMRSSLSASAYVSDIYLSDLLESNRQIVRKWLQNAPDALDISKTFKYVANLEGKDDIKYLEERVRKCVKDVISCDILADNPLGSRSVQQFDIVTSGCCLDCFPDYKDYLKAWRNLACLTRPGGYVLVVGIFDCSYYKVGEKKLPGSNLDENLTKNAISQAGLQTLEFEKFAVNDLSVDGDWTTVFTVLTQKC